MLACSTQKFSGILVDLYFQFSNFGFKQASKQISSADIYTLINLKRFFPDMPPFLILASSIGRGEGLASVKRQ